MPSLYEKLKTIQDTLNFEIDNHYINSRGQKATFTGFIIDNIKSLSFIIEDKEQIRSLINLFNAYSSQDLNSRIHTIHKAQEVLKQISERNKRTIETDKSEGQSSKLKQTKTSYEKDLKKIDVKYVKGVGPKIAQTLNKLGIFSINDLLTYYPRTHINYQNQKLIKDLHLDENVTIAGTIKRVGFFSPPKRKDLIVFTITVHDETGKLTITRFISGRANRVVIGQYKKQFYEGAKVICSGTVSYDKFAKSFCLNNATIEVLENNADPSNGSLNTARIVPIYALTEGLSQEHLRKVITNAFNVYGNLIEETLPKQLVKEEKLLDLKTSLQKIHFPDSQELCDLARQRIVFEEFFLLQLQLAFRRYKLDQTRSGLNLKESNSILVNKLLKSLPFTLTDAQNKVFNEIKKDLMSKKPMHRLLQGDVGSGKTVVALLSLLFAIENGYQTALMAPTEILVQQHARKFEEYCDSLKEIVQIGMITGSTPAKAKKEIYKKLSDGTINLIIGTHALIQDDVLFKNLGLVIIDEQHRFGVKQRDSLLKKGKNVERLFMTATPIPRTLALAVHGDLELSEIDEMPKGRIPIKTVIVQPWQRAKAYDLIQGEIAKGRQAYIVFPLIEESEAISAKAATIEYEELSKTIFKDLKLGLMHGELPSSEKEKVMQEFVTGKIDILVTTTVIEVGVDVTNATVMMIENGERFGLSQLHQLRGRVGRGGAQSFCLLAVQNSSDEAFKRLNILTKTNNGFIISQEDLKIRGPGEFLGTKQSGLPNLNMADIIIDAPILELARKKAIEIMKEDSDLNNYPELQKLITEKENTYLAAG